MAEFLVVFYGSVRGWETDLVTNTVPKVTGELGRTFDAFAREHAPAFELAGSNKELDSGSDSG
jgi:hypothetical protein